MLADKGVLPMAMGRLDDGFLEDLNGGDTPGGVETTESLAIGATLEGVVGIAGDADWYRVTLTAGAHYRFVLSGHGDTPLIDPFLRLLRADGTLVASDDDSGTDHDAALRFTPTEGGTYYISAEGFATSAGGYRLSAEVAPAQDPLSTIDWGTKLQSGQVVIYFAKTGESFGGATATRDWTPAEKAAALAAGGTISAVTNVSFTATDTYSASTMVLVLDSSLEASGRMTTPGGERAIGVFKPGGPWSTSTLSPGGAAFETLVHEFGHALGLAHPHDPGGTSEVMEGVDASFGSYGSAGLNQSVFTIMSYNPGFSGGDGNMPTNYTYGSASTPMALDIAALQRKYGVAANNAGNTTYYLGSVSNQYVAIWDTGGVDTIVGNTSHGLRIDLRAATLLNEAGGGGYVSGYAPKMDGGYTIAAGVEIENAVGSETHDSIIGNALDNVLEGRGGDDVIDGGDGNDTASFESSARVKVSLAITGPQDTGVGRDTLISIENLIGAFFMGDELTGDGRANRLSGLGGDDILDGGGGGDVLDGGEGFDTASYVSATLGVNVDLSLLGPRANVAPGEDILISIEALLGSAFSDVLRGDGAANRLLGGAGDDVLDGAGGVDIASYADALSGVAVNLGITGPQQTGRGLDSLISIEWLEGSAWDDVLSGGVGDDLLRGGAGNDQLTGGAGLDVASFRHATGAVTVDLALTAAQTTGEGLDLLTSIEGIEGGAFNDTLIGDVRDNLFLMTRGYDIIRGGAGSDTISYQYADFAADLALWDYESGAYTYRLTSIENAIGSAFDDWIAGNDSDNILSGLDGNDRLIGFLGANILMGGAGNDILNGGNGSNQLYGQDGDDILYGGGTSARSFLYGGRGSDTYYVSSFLDGPVHLIYEGGDNPDLMAGDDDVDIIVSTGNFFWDYYGVAEILRGGGQLVGGTQGQTIQGGDGTEVILAYGGSNRVDAGWGTDAVSFDLFGLDESFDGANTLVMKPRSGLDYVYGFESGVDKIDLTAFSFGITGEQVLNQAINVDQAGTENDYCFFYLTTTFGVDNFIVFVGLLSSQLQASDFMT